METTVTRQVEGPGWFLKDSASMLEVLDKLSGWDGDVTKADGVYCLVLRQSGKNTITAPARHWLVPDGDELKLMDRTQFRDAGYRADDFPPEAEPDPEPPEVVEQRAGWILPDGVDIAANERDTGDTARPPAS